MRAMHLGDVDLNLLPALAALLDDRHVSRAAVRVGLSQPAMSRALQRLRRRFGDELLVRSSAGYVLTPRAERIHQQLASVVPDLDALFGPETFDPATAAQEFRLTLTECAVAAFGVALARYVRRESPNSAVFFDALDDRALDKLDSGRSDLLALARTPPRGYRHELLLTDDFVCVVAANHALAKQQSMSLEEYLRWTHLAIDVENGMQSGVDPTLNRISTPRRIAVTTPFHVTAPAALPGTDLVLTFPTRLVSQFVDLQTTRLVQAPPEITAFDIHAVWHPRLDNDLRHQWLRRAVRAAADGRTI